MLYERLTEFSKKRRLVGFCKWKNGKGLLFGRVLEVDRTNARFELVDVDGSLDEVMDVALADITRLETSPAYVKRLMLFAKLRIRNSKGQSTTSRSTITSRLRLAHRTGECVALTLKDDPRRDYRVVAIGGDWVEVEEHVDDPFVVVNRLAVHVGQIETLRWRSTGENAVTAAWKAARSRSA